jgi:hypothetical protein
MDWDFNTPGIDEKCNKTERNETILKTWAQVGRY